MTKQFWIGIMAVGCLALGTTGAVHAQTGADTFIGLSAGNIVGPPSPGGTANVNVWGDLSLAAPYTVYDVRVSIRRGDPNPGGTGITWTLVVDNQSIAPNLTLPPNPNPLRIPTTGNYNSIVNIPQFDPAKSYQVKVWLMMGTAASNSAAATNPSGSGWKSLVYP